MMIKKWLSFPRASACLISLLSATTVAVAQDDETGLSALTLRGFGTVGLVRSTDGQAEVARDLLQPRGVSNHWSGKIDSNLGVQLNYLASESVEAVIQAVSRYNYKGNYSPELTEALLKYDPSPYISLRMGRVGTDLFMHGDSRLIGYSQLAARPNIDYYSSLAVTYLDGGDLQATFPLGEGLLRAKGYYGFLREMLPFDDEHLDLRGSRAIGGYLDYQQGGWQWRAGMAQISFKHSVPSPLSDVRSELIGSGVTSAQKTAADLELQGTKARYYSMGVVYDRGPLLMQVMLGRLSYDSKAIQDQDSAMFLAGYRIGNLKPFIGYSRARSRASPVSSGLPDTGSHVQINAALNDYLAESHVDQHTYSIGLRWDFRRDMALKLQADAIRGKPDSIYTFRRESDHWDGKTNVFTLVLDFIF